MSAPANALLVEHLTQVLVDHGQELRELHHLHVVLDANARGFIAELMAAEATAYVTALETERDDAVQALQEVRRRFQEAEGFPGLPEGGRMHLPVAQLRTYTIYRYPKGHRASYVLRAFTVTAAGAIPDAEPMAVADTLDGARDCVPKSAWTRIEPAPDEHPTIIETWL